MIQANGTDAKEIALHFVNLTNTRATSHFMGKTIVQAKGLLHAGYTKEEIIACLDYAVLKRGVQMFSLGYLSAGIHNLLRDIEREKREEELARQKEEVKEALASQTATSEVIPNDQSKERNTRKAEQQRAHLQSRFGKKFNLDMFEGQ